MAYCQLRHTASSSSYQAKWSARFLHFMNSAIMLTAAMLGSVELLAAIINVYFIIGEPVNGLQWLGMGLILGGILISENKT